LGMKEITVQELKQLLDTKSDFQLIDVREGYEYDQANIGGEHIPMAEVPHNINRIQTTKQVVVHCRSGGRSGNIIQWLEKNHGFDNLYNLKGGILAWAREIDDSLDIS
jgi:sulfur-carrier protein adenylyltransferase/sulfurtransferase